MLLDERHAKELFAASGIPVPPSTVVMPGRIAPPGFPAPWMLKSQVLSGGRGKAGAIVRVDSAAALESATAKLFALPVGGKLPPSLLIEPAMEIVRELYLSLAVSRDRESLVLTVRPGGGVEVEAAGGGLIQNVRLPMGPSDTQVRAAFFALRLDSALYPRFAAVVRSLYAATAEAGLLLAEINPLAVTRSGELVALDAKAEVDDSVLAIKPELSRYFEPGHLDVRERAAREAGFSYVGLPGWVGCLVNGAGLAMATMDALAYRGLAPANFLDLGGAADERRIRQALDLLFDDDRVKAVCINLYGGILSCAQVAKSLLAVLGETGAPKPVVARLAGNGAAEGLGLLAGSPVPGLSLASDMTQALDALAHLGPHVTPASRPGAASSSEAAPLPRLPRATGSTLRDDVPWPLDFGPHTQVLVQGATGKAARLHAGLMRAYGTNVVAGVTPFKGGQQADGVPVYDSVAQAVARHRVDLSIVFVPGHFAAEAVLEAADAGVPWIVCITEGIPQHDMLAMLPLLRRTGARLIGPNTPGIIKPGRPGGTGTTGGFKAGIMPVDPFSPGPVAVLSRSGTLTYEASKRLTQAGIGQALAVGIGGDPFIGLGFEAWLELLRDDDRVQAVLMLGEIGGRAEEDAAAYVAATDYPKPVAAFVAGLTAPPGRRMGHAGAILEEGGGAGRKLAALASAGISLCPDLDAVAAVVGAMLATR